MIRRALTSAAPQRTLIAAGVAAVTAGAWLAAAPTAGAAFPGNNGLIAFVSTRSNQVAVYQVNPQAQNLGTVAGDQAATNQITDGGGDDDAEPFYSADGNTIYFSSNRSGRWAIYSIPAADGVPLPVPPNTAVVTPPTELSQVSGQESHDDYAPSATPNGKYIVFNRDNTQLWVVDVTAANPAGTACLLYAPPTGLKASSDNGADSRPVFDPVDGSKLVYADAAGHLHLLTGIPVNSEPCAPAGLQDMDLSAAATLPANSPANWSTGSDQDPDWNPTGTGLVFDSTRGGGHQLWTMNLTNLPAVQIGPVWAGQVGPAGVSATQPAYSPDGTRVTFTEPVVHNGVQVEDFMLAAVGQPINQSVDLTLTTGAPQNSQPDWQPVPPGENVPESPYPVLLPGLGLLGGGIALLLRRRRLETARA